MDTLSPDRHRLLAIKLVHTVVWAFFAGCIVAIPVAAAQGHLKAALVLCAVVFVEVLVLLFNGMACPLTPIAGRYTDDRRPNHDIFLPEWLARYNKEIFGTLYAAGLAYVAYLWMR
ncbi:MAG: hypothetical protein AMXMBFR53_36290 [Gemmatimonadota bacterium]